MRFAIVIAFAVTACSGQQVQIGTNYIDFDAQTEPGVPMPLGADAFATVDLGGRIVIHRSLSDSGRHLYFGYDMVLEHQNALDPYMASYQPLSTSAANLVVWPDLQHPVRPAEWTYQRPAEYPHPMILQPGVRSSIVLTARMGNGQRLLDSVAIELRFTLMGVSVNDSSQVMPFREMSTHGTLVWVYLPGRGRFILSTDPPPDLGFEKAGKIRGAEWAFTVGGDRFKLRATGALAPGGVERDLYVLHDSVFEPTGQGKQGEIQIGSVNPREIAVLARK